MSAIPPAAQSSVGSGPAVLPRLGWAGLDVRARGWLGGALPVAVGILVALPIAFTMAWLIARTDMPGRTVLELLCWTGIFLPVLPLTFGWILLADGQFGLVNLALKQLPFIHGSVFNVYGFWGIVWVHIACSTV